MCLQKCLTQRNKKISNLQDNITSSCGKYVKSGSIADVDLYSCCIGNPQPPKNKPCNMKRFKALLQNKKISQKQYQTLKEVYEFGVVNKNYQNALN